LQLPVTTWHAPLEWTEKEKDDTRVDDSVSLLLFSSPGGRSVAPAAHTSADPPSGHRSMIRSPPVAVCDDQCP
jgi:hypothetical protein